MTLEELAAITRRVIARDGVSGFQPTACFPQRRQISALAGLPPDVDVEAETLSWAQEKADPGEEFLVAFLVSDNRFKIIRRFSGTTEEQIFAV